MSLLRVHYDTDFIYSRIYRVAPKKLAHFVRLICNSTMKSSPTDPKRRIKFLQRVSSLNPRRINLPPYTSIFTAELVAIKLALTNICKTKYNQHIIFF